MRIIGILHILVEVSRHCPVCAHGWLYQYGTYLREVYGSVQQVYDNTD